MLNNKNNGFLHGAYAGIRTENARRLRHSVKKEEPTEEKEEIYFLQTASGSVVLNGVAFVDLGGGKVLLPNAEFVNDGSGTLMIR